MSDGHSTSAGNALREAQKLRETGVPSIVVTVIDGRNAGSRLLISESVTNGTLGDPKLDETARALAAERLESGTSGLATIGDNIKVFVDVVLPKPLLVLVGAVHVAQAVTPLAQTLGYRVAVVDARETLANADRFPTVDQILVAWPDDAYPQLPITSSSAIVILTHDPKFDEPAIVGAVATAAGYIGAVGSRKTIADRQVRLVEAGLTEDQLGRVYGPIGLNIGGSSPEEMALSILAEVVAVRNGRPAGFLRDGRGSVRSGG